MASSIASIRGSAVALLAEGVDRNSMYQKIKAKFKASPSSRRAWIEIPTATDCGGHPCKVALLAEGVDRNVDVD